MSEETQQASASSIDGAKKLFMVVGLIAVPIIFLGFSATYWIPVLTASSDLSLFVHVHALSFFAWTLIFQEKAFYFRRNI